MLVASDLADLMKDALGFGDFDTSDENLGFAEAIVEHLQTAVVNHLPGSILGIAPPSGGPLTNGEAVPVPGNILLVPADLVAGLSAKLGQSTPEIAGIAEAISEHFLTAGVQFETGDITGTCTNTPASPGALIGEGTGGKIVFLSGPILAAEMADGINQPSVSPELLELANAIVDYVGDNAEVSYATGTVTGTAPAGGGPIPDGAGTGGTIA